MNSFCSLKPEKTYRTNLILLLVVADLISFSCSPARRLTEGEYLLDKTEIKSDTKAINIKELKRYERISQNKTILGVKFHLFLYNLANPDKDKFPHGWLRKIGEPPIVYDYTLQESTAGQYLKYLENKGYYHAIVTDTAFLNDNRKRANIIYDIKAGEPYTINKINYVFEDTSIASYIYHDTVNSLINKGDPFDKDILQEQRLQYEKTLKNKGFFRFSKEYVFYEAERVENTNLVNLEIIFKESLTGPVDPITKVRKHRRFKIDQVYINPDSEQLQSVEPSDTINDENSHIVFNTKPKIKSNTVISANNCIPGYIYNIDDVNNTYRNYTNLGLFRFVNLRFTENKDRSKDSLGFSHLNCFIDLSPRKIQSYQFEIVGTNSSGDFGMRGNLTYNNYNLFRGAEHLRIVLTGAVEALIKRQELPPMREFGAETSLELPKFLLPFSPKEFVRKYNPKTTLQISYNYQDRPDYLRTIINASFGYRWTGNKFVTHQIRPLDFYYVRLPNGVNSAFYAKIENTPLENSFINHTILGLRYSFEYTNQDVGKRKNFMYLHWNFESAGFILDLLKTSPNTFGPDSSFLGVPYFQYIKNDIDFRHYNLITSSNRIVYRLFVGVGLPYGNSGAMPFEKMYFSGGPYGIRAWNTRDLGPGSYYDTTNVIAYANNLGDIKIEGNIEYRFKLFWKLEGAFFLDAGNIWLMKNYGLSEESDETDLQERARFNWNSFYKEIALGTGIGFRFDFNFFLIRTDFGLKLRDPSRLWKTDPENPGEFLSPWIFREQSWTFQFGIGYPF